MAVRNQQALYELIDEKLNENSYGVDFRVDLYNAGTSKYYTKDEEGQKHRFVPTMITDVVGEYLNIPNANSTSNQVGISFDIFTDKQGELNDQNITELENVGYTDTLNAIEEFKSSLLAKYFPLGTPYLYMGGEDSKVSIDLSANITPKFFYLKLTPYNTEDEMLFSTGDSTKSFLYKDETDIYFFIDVSNTISIPYTAKEEIEITVYHDGTNWNIESATDSDSKASTTYATTDKYYIGGTSATVSGDTGLEAYVKRFVVSEETESSLDDIDTTIIDISTWDSKDTITNSGLGVVSSGTIDNSILWSEDGNAIFGFKTLNPVSNIRPIDGEYYYQEFELEADVFISNDVLFGNNFEYFLKLSDDTVYEQIYPIDRQHTLATEVGSAQKINNNYNEHVVEESVRDHTLSFYYIPSRKLTKMLKHLVSSDIDQNTLYTLKVQYPFFNVEYEVILDSGGLQPNINTLSTFSLTLKRKASFLT